MRTLYIHVLVLSLLLLVPATGQAQQDAASIVGVVTDSSRGVVPKAAVSVTNIATGITTVVEANERGLYNVSGLRPGEYLVIVESPGFSKFVRSDVTLNVAQVRSSMRSSRPAASRNQSR
jgi:hypothetical protein